eukprot:CAMPEP_0172824722 /NCGR_PEP_ID=MMETSP1075-20121228/18190_1 /TAXON_ID=2916 /ORGANISM="Ceratium fusus, Strain PA161109" /LENGTH=457 /DNA_ID=CAMNT_0013666047 /DNA_START=1 /DNA_END=1374 /DNA_ORIENTATION=-
MTFNVGNSYEGMSFKLGSRKTLPPTANTEGMAFKVGNSCEDMSFNLDSSRTLPPTANTEGMTFKGGNACEGMSFNLGKVLPPTAKRIASPAHPPCNVYEAASAELRRASSTSYSPSDATTTFAQTSFQTLEERIDAEVKERHKLWSSLIYALGVNQATVKRLEEKLENMEYLLQEKKGWSHKLEGNLQEVGERYNALEGQTDQLKEHYGMLQVQLQTLQTSVEQRSPLEQMEKTQEQLQTQLARFAVNLQEAQLANERQCTQLQVAVSETLQVAVSETQAQALANDACSTLETRLKAEIVHWKSSQESLAEQLVELHARSEKRCSALEARVGSLCVPELDARVLANNACSALEARLKAEIVQWKCSQENLAEQLAELHTRSDRRCSNLEARVGGVCVPELVSSMAEGLHTRINAVQAVMERRYSGQKPTACSRLSSGISCNGYTRQASPVAVESRLR